MAEGDEAGITRGKASVFVAAGTRRGAAVAAAAAAAGAAAVAGFGTEAFMSTILGGGGSGRREAGPAPCRSEYPLTSSNTLALFSSAVRIVA